jgi:hypothetical protein
VRLAAGAEQAVGDRHLERVIAQRQHHLAGLSQLGEPAEHRGDRLARRLIGARCDLMFTGFGFGMPSWVPSRAGCPAELGDLPADARDRRGIAGSGFGDEIVLLVDRLEG